MDEKIIVKDLYKYFNLSKKQMKISKTNEAIKKAVDGISFSVKEGEIFGLLGPNGAGKTTTLRCIATLITPNSGEIIIDGVSTKNDLEVKKKIAFLTNELKLEDNFTPNYIFDYFASLYDLDEEKTHKRKKELFDVFGIQKFCEVKIKDLSQGMKQKISIAVSLVHDPDVIVFDEPTNGLDIVTAKTVTDYLINLRNMGKTIIISTHIMDLIEKLCSRVGIIIDGKLVACDSIDNLRAEAENNDLEEMFFNIFKKSLEDKGEI